MATLSITGKHRAKISALQQPSPETVEYAKSLHMQVLCVESYVGRWARGPGVKLEDQVLITAEGHEVLSHYPYEAELLG